MYINLYVQVGNFIYRYVYTYIYISHVLHMCVWVYVKEKAWRETKKIDINGNGGIGEGLLKDWVFLQHFNVLKGNKLIVTCMI